MLVKYSIVLVVVVAFIAPYLYDRYLALSALVLANGPGRTKSISTFTHHEIKFRERVRNCEDVLMDEKLGLAFLSCDPGRDLWNTVMGTFLPRNPNREGGDSGQIWIYDYATPDLSDADALRPLTLTEFDDDGGANLHPLGIDFDTATSTLYVINHSRTQGPVVEIFHVSIPSATARHLQTLKHPLLHAPNSVHVIDDGKLLLTNDHYFRASVSPLLSKVESYSGLPGGTAVYVDVHNASDAHILAHIPFANGITMLNTTTLAVASSTKAGVYLYTLQRDQQTPSLQLLAYIRTPAAADNLSVDSQGKLLIAGHPHAPSLAAVAQRRAKCNLAGSDVEKRACECNAPSWVAEWSEESGLRNLYTNDGTEFCSSSTFARDAGRGVGIMSGLYERGILVARE